MLIHEDCLAFHSAENQSDNLGDYFQLSGDMDFDGADFYWLLLLQT